MNTTENRGMYPIHQQSDNSSADFTLSHAIIIGINDYIHGIPPLRTAVNDAQRLAHILEQDYNYQVYLHTDATLATLHHLLTAHLPQIVGNNDRVLFYFAGHGMALDGLEDDDGPTGYLVPQDAHSDARDSFLSMQDLHDALTKLPCRHLLAILDCCFAGTLRWATLRDWVRMPDVIHRERYLRYIRDPAWQVITSAAYDQPALDMPWGMRAEQDCHSPFALALFDALAGAGDIIPANGGDGLITATELYLYLRDRVESHTIRQTPGLWPLRKHDKGEYLFQLPNHELNLPPAPTLSQDNNPYRGLEAYEEVHHELFFGRDTQIAALAEQVRHQKLTIVLGASGTGKSSLVKAGLLPRLRTLNTTTSVEGKEDWLILSPLRPGEQPATNLDKLLQAPSLTENDGYVLLVIDQLEEVLTLCREETQRRTFFATISQFVAQSNSHHVVFTLRTDFEPPLAAYFSTNLPPTARFIVPPMTQDELRQAIERPASARVLYFEPSDLPDKLINEVIQTPGALPLLSFTLSELYLRYLERQSDNRALIAEDYAALGGVIGSLRQRATAEYDELEDNAHRLTMQNIMLRMVAVEGGEATRRRVPRSELVYPDTTENQRVETVLNKLIAARLLVTDEADGIAYVEPAHDALVRAWDKLLAWRDAQEKQLPFSLQRRLTQVATDWEKANKKTQTGLLWHNNPYLSQLEKVLRTETEAKIQLNRSEEKFIHHSLELRQRRRWQLWGSVTTVVIASVIAAIVFYVQRQEALLQEHQRTVDGATTALSRGDFKQANRLYEVAIEQTLTQNTSIFPTPTTSNLHTFFQTGDIEQVLYPKYTDLPALTIGNLRTFFQTGNRERLKKQLDTIETMQNLGTYTATFLLLKGDFMMSDALTTYKGRELMKKTLLAHEAELKAVSEADVLYARGLVAENYYDALHAYETALEKDAFHYRANAALMTSYAFSGEFEKAAELGQFMKRVFRENIPPYRKDTLPYFVDAWIRLLQGEYAQSVAIMDSVAEQIRPEKLEKLKNFLAVMNTVLNTLKKIERAPDGGGIMDWMSVSFNLTKLVGMAQDPVLGEFGLNMPTVNALFDSAKGIVMASVQYMSPLTSRKKALHQMELLTKKHPEAMFLNLYAIFKLMNSVEQYKGKALKAELSKIVSISQKASQSPSIVPWMAHRYAKLVAIFLNVVLQKPAQLTELSKDVHWIIDEARLSNHERNTFLPSFIGHLPYELALPLLTDWLQYDSNNYPPHVLLAELEFGQQNYVAALRAARKALAIKEHERMKFIEEQCLLQLKKLL